MATTILSSLCSSLTTQCKISHSPFSPSSSISLSKPHNSFSLPKTPKLVTSKRHDFSQVCKLSTESSSNVAELEQQQPLVEDSDSVVVEEEAITVEETAKREEVYAVIMVGGRQYIVFPGRFIYTNRLKGTQVNDKVALNKVLLVGTKTSTYIGRPVVTNAVVHAVVEEHGLNKKVIVYKYKKKKNYRRNIGHRQPNTRIRVTAITGYQDFPAVTLDSIKS